MPICSLPKGPHTSSTPGRVGRFLDGKSRSLPKYSAEEAKSSFGGDSWPHWGLNVRDYFKPITNDTMQVSCPVHPVFAPETSDQTIGCGIENRKASAPNDTFCLFSGLFLRILLWQDIGNHR